MKTTVLLDDMHNFAAMNGVYARYYTKDMPARVCYQVAKLPMGVKVEIDTIAVKNRKTSSPDKSGRIGRYGRFVD